MWLLHSSLFIGLSKVSRSKCLVYYVIKTIRPLYVDITTCFNSILYNLPTTLLSHVTSIKPWFVTYYGLMWISFVFYWAYFLFTLIWSWIIHCNEPQSYLEQNVFSWKTGVDSKHILLFRYWLYTYSLYPVHGQQVYVLPVIEICFYCSHRDQVLLEDYHKPNPEQEHLINVRLRKTIQKSRKFLLQKIWVSDELHWMNGGHHQGNHLCWHNQVSSQTFKMSWATSRNNQIKVKKILQTC